MTTYYPLKRFDVVKDNGIKDGPAQAYGPGAFCWVTRGDPPVKYIEFLTPEMYRGNEKYVEQGVPVEDGHSKPWHWDGNEDLPSLRPSISIKAKYGSNPQEWREVFHGFIHNGHLEVL